MLDFQSGYKTKSPCRGCTFYLYGLKFREGSRLGLHACINNKHVLIKGGGDEENHYVGSGFSGAGAWGVYDQKNSIVFGNYAEADVIGVTAIWYQGKNIYEYDILFDTDYLPGDGSVDLDSVVLHEFGHGAGLDDLYNTTCATEVMYGFYHGVDLDLGTGDTTGIQIMYGA